VSVINALGVTFQNPVLLAAGTAGFGREVQRVIDLDALGGLITKAVTPEARRGHPGPRVAEFSGGMLNAVGFANPGLEVVRHDFPRSRRSSSAPASS
jgi:dihydroorotate dehydrogenase (NAD+) catalytic subunit